MVCVSAMWYIYTTKTLMTTALIGDDYIIITIYIYIYIYEEFRCKSL